MARYLLCKYRVNIDKTAMHGILDSVYYRYVACDGRRIHIYREDHMSRKKSAEPLATVDIGDSIEPQFDEDDGGGSAVVTGNDSDDSDDSDDGDAKAKRTAAALASRQRKAAHLATVLDYVESRDDNPSNVTDAIEHLRGRRRTRKSTSKYSRVVAFLAEKGVANEMDLFQEFQVGRSEMQGVIRKAGKGDVPVWIAFDGSAYQIIGTGGSAPADWVAPRSRRTSS